MKSILENGAPKLVFSGEKDEVEFIMSDGSKMKVTLCRPCKDNLDDKHYKAIMKAVLEGWKEEIKELKWENGKKAKYLKQYGKLQIVRRV
jgi:uncharacterized membrane protein (UPF0127 family)